MPAGDFFSSAGADPTKRGLCQSVCLSVTCHTRQTNQSCESTCRVSANQVRSFCPWIGKQAGRAASRLWITRIAPSLKKRSGVSTSSLSKDVHSRSAKRARVKTVRPDLVQSASVEVVADSAAALARAARAREVEAEVSRPGPVAIRHVLRRTPAEV